MFHFFFIMSNVEQICEKYSITKDKYDEFMAVFNKFDADNSGAIDGGEIAQVMTQLNIDPKENNIEDMVKEADKNGDGEVDFEEFLQLLLVIEREEDLRAAFNKFDLDGNGSIDRKELSQVFQKMSGRQPTEEELDQMFDEADENKDGEISFDEFKLMMVGV
uniref:EF-hand domain-containing protein n=1 Tax=Vannella robusta TaxID=1487602 RepID=A0A7S4IS33_9EUKA|mmetsp:Transcript_7627/g.9456  ORF Transcript_7627/g.9456 Transcript_7627/m.9456 type:complete len:162 (+) Transcript_7627:28-513(+)